MKWSIGEMESMVFHQDLCSPLGMGAEGEERQQLVVCYRAGMRLGIGLKRMEGEVEVCSLPSCLSGWSAQLLIYLFVLSF